MRIGNSKFSLFINTFFEDISNHSIKYAVERNYQDLPYYTAHDIDIIIERKNFDLFLNVINEISIKLNYPIVQLKKSFAGGRVYYIDPSYIEIIRIDFMNFIHYRGIRLLNEDHILKTRKRYRNFFVPSPGCEAAISLVIPLIYKGKIKRKYINEIKKGILNDEENFDLSFESLLDKELLKTLKELVISDKYDELESMRKVMLRNYMLNNKFSNIIYFSRFVSSYFKRIRVLPGIFAVFLGPDGSGKTSIIDNLRTDLSILFPNNKFVKLHWRPNFLPKLRNLFGSDEDNLKETILNPHGGEKRFPIISFFRWIYYSLDYIIGYIFKIFPAMFISKGIFFDRYYYDSYVDPKRYGFNIPNFLIRSINFIIPKPDITFYIDNYPETLYERKKELPKNELVRQVNLWRNNIYKLPNYAILPGNKEMNEIVKIAKQIILGKMVEKVKKELENYKGNTYLARINDIYIALPNKKNWRWILPYNKKFWEPGWSFYNPCSLRGKIYKQFILSPFFRLIVRIFPNRYILSFAKSDMMVKSQKKFYEILRKVFNRDDIFVSVAHGSVKGKILGIALDKKGVILGFYKVGLLDSVIKKIMNEGDILKELYKNKVNFEIPRVLFSDFVDTGEYLLITAFSKNKIGLNCKLEEFNNKNLKSIIDRIFYSMKINDVTLNDYELLSFVNETIHNTPPYIFENLFRAFKFFKSHFRNRKLKIGLNHGDFTPWNIYISKNNLIVFDWEESERNMIYGYDIVHFYFQVGYLLKKLHGEKLLIYILKNVQPLLKEDTSLVVLFYLIFNLLKEGRNDLMYYLKPTREIFYKLEIIDLMIKNEKS